MHWPGSDLAIPVLAGFFVVVYFAYTALLRTLLPAAPDAVAEEAATP